MNSQPSMRRDGKGSLSPLWRRQVEDLQAQAEDALAKLEKDPQVEQQHRSCFQLGYHLKKRCFF